MDARGAQARDDEIAPLAMGMRRIGTEARRAGIPAKMMQLIAGIRHLHRTNDAGIGLRLRVYIDHRDRVRHFAIGIESRNIGEGFGGGLHGHAGRGIETGIRLHQAGHGLLLPYIGRAIPGADCVRSAGVIRSEQPPKLPDLVIAINQSGHQCSFRPGSPHDVRYHSQIR